jgi:hypothetical protein
VGRPSLYVAAALWHKRTPGGRVTWLPRAHAHAATAPPKRSTAGPSPWACTPYCTLAMQSSTCSRSSGAACMSGALSRRRARAHAERPAPPSSIALLLSGPAGGSRIISRGSGSARACGVRGASRRAALGAGRLCEGWLLQDGGSSSQPHRHRTGAAQQADLTRSWPPGCGPHLWMVLPLELRHGHRHLRPRSSRITLCELESRSTAVTADKSLGGRRLAEAVCTVLACCCGAASPGASRRFYSPPCSGHGRPSP